MSAGLDKEQTPGKSGEDLAVEVVEFFENLLMRHNSPEPTPEMLLIPGLARLYNYLAEIKEVLGEFSAGRFERDIKLSGSTAGLLKNLRGNIRHLTWQCLMVAEGDLTQRVDFMGEFSEAFNRMTKSLAEYREMLEMKQAELLSLTEELQQEIKQKEEVECTLKASEEMYRQRSLRDPLTGIYNRSYFFETAAREMENLKRTKDGGVCILMIDIDHFKAFNDTHGHLCGDQAIKMVTACIDRILRKSDIFARYGGEEFVVFLPGASLDRGLVIAERIRVAVSETPSPAGDGKPVTISIGLACVRGSEINPKLPGSKLLLTAIEEADTSLYSAKENGRNRVFTRARA